MRVEGPMPPVQPAGLTACAAGRPPGDREPGVRRWLRGLGLLLGLAPLAGCAVSPIPHDIARRQQAVRALLPELQPQLQEGDILFRMGEVRVLNGQVNFSHLIGQLTRSDFSHAAIVYKVADDGVLVADVSVEGIERRYLNDWLMDGPDNLVVKRVKPDYRAVLPRVSQVLRELVEADVLYDADFREDDRKFYCTEAVDYCYRQAGLPLAEHVRIRELPGYNLWAALGCLLVGLNVNEPVIIAGNDRVGLFSSPYLETVLDLRAGAGPVLAGKTGPPTPTVQAAAHPGSH